MITLRSLPTASGYCNDRQSDLTGDYDAVMVAGGQSRFHLRQSEDARRIPAVGGEFVASPDHALPDPCRCSKKG